MPSTDTNIKPNLRNTRVFREELLAALGVTDDLDVENEQNFKSALLTALNVEHGYQDIANFEAWREKLIEAADNISEGGGGGSSDFSTAEVTLTATIPIDEGFITSLPVLESDGLSTLTEINLDGHNQIIKTIVLYKGKTTVPGFGFFTVNSISGNIAADGESYIITGNCTVTLAPTE